MKFKLTLLFVLLLSCLKLLAQIVHIPDANFEAALISLGYDNNNGTEINGSILVSEAEAVTILNVSSQGIGDLTGIEGFVNLTLLRVSDNSLSSINLLENTALVELYIRENNLTELFVNSGRNLENLDCSSNISFQNC